MPMLFHLENEIYDTMIVPSDWRFSAAITGLMRYFTDQHMEGRYAVQYHSVPEQDFDDECLLFYWSDLTENRYLQFVTHFFRDDLPLCQLKELLEVPRKLSDDEIESANGLLAFNAIMKKVFPKVKYTEENRESIRQRLMEQADSLIKETYRNKKNLYANFANPNCLGKDSDDVCRLWGYYVDVSRKGKSLGYGFDKNKMTVQDSLIFDFIPFAFQGGREQYFIHNNLSIREMVALNDQFHVLAEKMESDAKKENKLLNDRKIFWSFITKLMSVQAFDVEVIAKNLDEGFFRPLFVRRESVEILKQLAKRTENDKQIYDAFTWSYTPDNGKTYLDIQKITIESVLNLNVLDSWIEYFLREELHDKSRNFDYLIHCWIGINLQIRHGGGKENMRKEAKSAYQCAQKVRAQLKGKDKQNKLDMYITKLTSSVISHDYQQVCDILLQLSNYTGIYFNFAYSLYEDFEENKDIIYTFITALRRTPVEEADGQA